MLWDQPRGLERRRERAHAAAKCPGEPLTAGQVAAPLGGKALHRFWLSAGILAMALWLSGCSVGYLLHLGRGQMRIVCGSERVEDVLRDPEVPESAKRRIRLVLEAKHFGEGELGLTVSKNYTRYYAVENPPLAYNLTASPRLELEAYRWCFPIAGCLPYKGFFDRERAVHDSERMARQGYDTYLRPVGAYSTLGWFTDPVFSTMLEYGDTGLVEVILHEMVHRTIFVKDQGAFNEGVATFVGERGTEAFFRKVGGAYPDSSEALRQAKEARKLFEETMSRMADRLRVLYGSDLEEAEKLRKREEIFRDAKEALRENVERLDSARYQGVLREDWNNAFLVSYLTYHQDPDLWESVYGRFDQDLRAMVAWLKRLESDKDPLFRVRQWLVHGDDAASH
jgi:predicted aminopeptidase